MTYQIRIEEDFDASAVQPSKAAISRLRRRSQQLAGRVRPPAKGRKTLVELDPANFLERIDDSVRVGADRHRDSSLTERSGRADAVRKIAMIAARPASRA